MFDMSQKNTWQDTADALTTQAIGCQSVLYRIFKNDIGCDDSNIRKLSLTYFATTVVTYSFIRFGDHSNKVEILDSFTKSILTQSLRASKEEISFDDVVEEYQWHYSRYKELINALFIKHDSSSEDPSIILLTRLFESVTSYTLKVKLTNTMTSSLLIQELILDNVNFVKEKL